MLRGQLAALHDESARLPLDQRRGTAVLLAVCAWEPIAFRLLRRGARSAVTREACVACPGVQAPVTACAWRHLKSRGHAMRA